MCLSATIILLNMRNYLRQNSKGLYLFDFGLRNGSNGYIDELVRVYIAHRLRKSGCNIRFAQPEHVYTIIQKYFEKQSLSRKATLAKVRQGQSWLTMYKYLVAECFERELRKIALQAQRAAELNSLNEKIRCFLGGENVVEE